MHNLNNNKKNNSKVTAAKATIIFILAIMTMSIMGASAAATTTTEAGTTTQQPSSSSGLELSPQPVYRERQITVSQTPINQTHILFTDSGGGTLMLPNSTEAINVTSIDNVIVSTIDGTAVGKEVFTTVDGSENATAKLLGIARFNMEEGTSRAIVISVLQTNSTGRLASLDGMILAGHVQFQPDGSAMGTLWEWHSGIPLPTPITTTPPLEEPPLMDTTTTMTNTTTADDTTATTAAEQGEEQQQQQQQTTPTTPPNPLFE